ncbi:uncharacterized protein EV422DRAFT_564706 [Fimicolochytrium jonesii]|uniref:uncharacterized protein n=1 Tax=Fimicolochytrium jonesii TaxID=1396493 RepID=UPI0022FEB996|nr:uncharacterized protein EV422DRAFT_564706 [Fimicolochytrium jonesii]KAI8824000.1 hypothetical protein EV422DRAFT_564706 [Fimicolochytrium jonesii]
MLTNSKETKPTFLVTLPEELIEAVLAHCHDPSRLVRTCKLLHTIGARPGMRAKWFLQKYGPADAVQGSLRWTKLLSVEALELVFKFVPVVPRYVIQRALTRFQHTNQAHLVVPLLKYGLTHYDDLSLHKNDGQTFKELLPYASGLHIHTPPFLTVARLETMEKLVIQYRFDVNFCKWNPTTGTPLLFTNEGFRVFLTAVASGNSMLVKALLKHKMVTHVHRFINPYTGLSTTPFEVMTHLFDAGPHWEETFFAPELRTYLRKTTEALLLATKNKHLHIMKLLLTHDLDRWDTSDGVEVLSCCLQLAVDESFEFGVELLTEYLGANPPPKSDLALKRALRRACLDGDLKGVKMLIKEGASFENIQNDFVFGMDPLKHIIALEKAEIFQYLIKNLEWDRERLSQLLTYAIDCSSSDSVRFLLRPRGNKQMPTVTERHLRRCVVHANADLMPILLRTIEKQVPDKVIPGFNAVLRLAQRRAVIQTQSRVQIVHLLEEYFGRATEKARSWKAKTAKRKGSSGSTGSSSSKGREAGLGVAPNSGVVKKNVVRNTMTSRRASEAQSSLQ